jgi:anti-anti-sigma regulatory factor
MFEFEEKTITTADGSPYLLIPVSGSLSIENIVVLKELLLKAFAEFNHVVMDWEKATYIDFSVIQLMCATNDYAQHNKKQFEVKNRFISPFIDKTQALGFICEEGCSSAIDPARCLWIPNLD